VSKLDGFAGKNCELFWVTGELEHQKFQITNLKYQTNNNDQNSKFQTCFVFWSLSIGI
jgi:hypothetical protein